MNALASEVTAGVTDTLFGVNTLGPIKLTRAALPLMLARNKGRIVVVASMAGKVPSPGQAVYSGTGRFQTDWHSYERQLVLML